MRVTVTGASGLIGRRLVTALARRGWEIAVLSRDAAATRDAMPQGLTPQGDQSPTGAIDVMQWNPVAEVAPVAALTGRDAVIHLAGATISQRWTGAAKSEISDSRVVGTRNLVKGIGEAAAAPNGAPKFLLGASAIGYYGPRGAEPLDEDSPAGSDFLAEVCVSWEREAAAAAELGLRVVALRTGVVLDASGGALAKMLPPFRAGIGGPVAGGHQYVSWVHGDDVVGIMLACCDDEHWSGAVNATAPQPVTNADLSRALGRVLHRPALLPVPALALRAMYGEMASLVTTGARVMPAKALVLGYDFKHTEIDEALSDALG
jgi:hypothetical protein